MIVRRSLFFPIVKILCLMLIVLAVAVFVALKQVNLETLRGRVVTILQEATGLPVQVDGAVSWRFSVRPYIELEQVRVANADWAKNKYAIEADKIDVRLNLFSVFRDRPTIQNVKIYDAKVNVEKNKDGNYSIKLAKKIKQTNAPVVGPDVYPFADMGLGGVEVRNLKVHFDKYDFDLAGFNVRLMPDVDRREYSGWIKFDKDVAPFIVSMGKYNSERKIYPVQVALSTGAQALIANLALEGTSKLPIDFVIKGDVPNFGRFSDILGINFSGVPGVKLSVSGGVEHNKIVLRKSVFTVRETEFVVSGMYDWGKEIPKIKLNLSSDYVALTQLFPDLYRRAKTKKDAKDLNVFKDVPLFGEYLLNKDIDLNLALKRFVVFKDLDIQNLDMKMNLHDNHARVDSVLLFADGDVRFAVDANIDNDGRIWADVGFRGESVSVGNLLTEIHVDDFISDLPMNVEVFVKANGRNLTEVMRSVTGPVFVYSVGKGYAHSALVAYMYGTDFLTSLRHGIEDLFSSDKKHNQIKISCVALNAKLRDGVFYTEKGVAIETNAINVRLAGSIDLGAETVGLSLTTVPVRGLKLSLTGNVVNSVEITGSLARPNIKISGAAVAGKVASATGIGLLLAPLTGGISIVAGAGIGLVAGDLLENWLADDSPCKTAKERGAPLIPQDPEWMSVPLDELINNILDNKSVL